MTTVSIDPLDVWTMTGVAADAASGDAADELARYSDSVDVLVMGAHKYRPIDHLSDGSTAQRLVNRASSPLLVLSARAHEGKG